MKYVLLMKSDLITLELKSELIAIEILYVHIETHDYSSLKSELIAIERNIFAVNIKVDFLLKEMRVKE